MAATNVNTIEDIYNVVNRIYAPIKGVGLRETTPPTPGVRSEWLPMPEVKEEPEPEQLYDTLESVVASMHQPQPVAEVTPTPAQPQEGGEVAAVPASSSTKPPAPESLVSGQ